jgi:hypothetical protein
LKWFNVEYARCRRMAGGSFMSYQQALGKYRAALASSIAGTLTPGDIIATVFGERS